MRLLLVLVVCFTLSTLSGCMRPFGCVRGPVCNQQIAAMPIESPAK